MSSEEEQKNTTEDSLVPEEKPKRKRKAAPRSTGKGVPVRDDSAGEGTGVAASKRPPVSKVPPKRKKQGLTPARCHA